MTTIATLTWEIVMILNYVKHGKCVFKDLKTYMRIGICAGLLLQIKRLNVNKHIETMREVTSTWES